MLTNNNPYNTVIPGLETIQGLTEEEITELLQKYLDSYKDCFVRSQQVRYFEAFVRGLLSNLDRKSIEPIALSLLGQKDVRGMQQFFTRSKGWDESMKEQYKRHLASQLNDEKGFLSVDESDFAKKGKESVGVSRQYCGRLGKQENCQAGVFVSYASEKGIGLIDSGLYLPEQWFGDDYAQKREDCGVPKDLAFKTKNEMAKQMVKKIIQERLFEIQCVGCDAAFGSDHTFLDSLGESVYYFASVRENERIFREMPEVVLPENTGKGGRYKHQRAVQAPVEIKTIVDDESIPWDKRIISEGVKGPIIGEIKCLRCVESRKENRLYMPKSEIWVYIRKHEDGTIKYFISNMPLDTNICELDRLATARWSIEQCFQECKSYLGMAHYETRSYQAWSRHMLLVMIAHLFVTVLREFLKKKCEHHNANGSLYHSVYDTGSFKVEVGIDDYSLSVAS